MQNTSEWLDELEQTYRIGKDTKLSRFGVKAFEEEITRRIAAERAAEYNLRPAQVREAMLRLYASTTGHTYESVKDEYLGKPLPEAPKYDTIDNKLYMQIESAVHFALADPQSKPKEKEE